MGFYNSTTKRARYFFPLPQKMMSILSPTSTSTGMLQESLSLPKTGLVPIRSCSRLLRSWRKAEVSTLAPSPHNAVHRAHGPLSHPSSGLRLIARWRAETESEPTGKRVCARKGKKLRCSSPSSLPLQREIMTWSRRQQQGTALQREFSWENKFT